MLHSPWLREAYLRRPGRQTLPEQVSHSLREVISRGAIRPGQRLPSVRVLAAHFGVSIPTLRMALHGLAQLGLVDCRRGIGTFVAAPRSGARMLGVAIRRARPQEASWLLRQLEAEGARRAAAVARQACAMPHHEALSLLAMERDRARAAWPDAFVTADLDFHRALLGAGGMTLAVQLHRRMAPRAKTRLLRHALELADDDRLSELHHRLAVAVAAGRIREAERLATRIAEREGALPSPHAAAPPPRRTRRLRRPRPPPR